ncbi:UNVERIFIED_CONTAM: hypothetical protein Sradi_0821900 [Sesamum radiatum]|uniref:Uncharacterized protein n=1 Tax=Sesamum radiatum TaxID=300843 RepID=A0AAW2VQT4_SESRA
MCQGALRRSQGSVQKVSRSCPSEMFKRRQGAVLGDVQKVLGSCPSETFRRR